MMESLYLWEKGCTNGIRTVEILPIFPCFLWGYVLIWYSCRDGCNAFPQKTRQRNQRKSGVWRG